MKPITNLSLAISCALFLTGCVNIATAKVEPGANLASIKTMYVKQLPADKRGVNEIVADKFRSKGVKVKTGVDDPSEPVDALVTYADKWMWDITMYMIELNLAVREPKSQTPIATGYSKHGSLTRLSPKEMVDEVVDNIYKDGNSGK